MQWYYIKDGSQSGPVSLDELRHKIACGELTSSNLVWREGMADWAPAPSLDNLPTTFTSSETARSLTMPSATFTHSEIRHVPNYLWQSIAVTILCCWPLGIPAIVYATKVDKLKNSGDLLGAISASNTAKMWCFISLGAMALFLVIYLIIAVAAVAAESA
jgi:hypothetical protein